MGLTMNYEYLRERYQKPKKKKKHSNGKKTSKGKKPQTPQKSPNTKKEYKSYWEILESKPSIKVKKNNGKGKKKKTLTYQQQLKDERWKKKRDKIIKLFKGKCCLCGKTEELNVHHLEYRSSKKAWEYPNSCFVVLCKDCHTKVHSDKNNKYYPKYK